MKTRVYQHGPGGQCKVVATCDTIEEAEAERDRLWRENVEAGGRGDGYWWAIDDVVLGSIILGDEDYYREKIVLSQGRILCDGDDITPQQNGMNVAEALKAVEQLYPSHEWGLQLADLSE